MKRYILSMAAVMALATAGAQENGLAFTSAPPKILIDEVKAGIIEGRVTTTDTQPAAGVSVDLQGTGKGTITDESGFFQLRNVKPGNYVLVVSFVGLQTKQQAVVVKESQTVQLSLSLTEDSRQLQAVIIQSYKSLNEKPVAIGKVAIAPMDLPQSIAVIGSEVIRDQQAQRLSDVIKNVNGVYLSTTRASTQENFSARGYSFSSTNLFKNGARINPGSMPEMSSLEKVEVLKGSAAILYGQVAPGGVVNMVTKQPKFRHGGELSMRIGSYDLYKPAFDIYGPLNGKVAYRINGTYEKAGSYRDVVGSERFYVNPSLLFKLGNRTELVVEGDYLKHNFTPDFGIGSLDNTKIPDVPRNTFYGTPWQYAQTQQATATATVKHELNDAWTLNGSLSYQKYNRDYYSTERIQAARNGDWKRPLGRTYTEEDYYTGQLNLNGKIKTGRLQHTILAGLDVDRYLTNNIAFNQPAIYDSINILDASKYVRRTDIPAAERIRSVDIPMNRYGVYVQDLIQVSSKFNVLAGLRYTYVQTKGADSTNLLTGKQSRGKDKTDKAFSPRLGLVYKPTETTSIFASYANSFNTNTGVDVDGNTLKPSIIDQYEVGVKNDFFGGRLSANITAYRIVNNNLSQTAPFLKDGVTPNNNTAIKALTGQTTSDGVELDLTGQPMVGLSLMAGYSYNYMRYTKTPNAKGNYVEGERLVNTPAHTANASAFYTLHTTALKGLKLGATANYVGNRFGGWNNTKEQTQTYSRLMEVDGFATIDLSAGYTYKKMSVLAKVSNLTNTYSYYMHENYSINPIPPRQFVATVAYRF
ncbi:TonB-dependent receptor [Paracnuella aquatica]|uniref:TonB-dependent receptor n=1 Tax=Paracnuella aquatica TaxID=2268757 RepID=UPI001F4D53D6|nr:TonB-dependent receptor [Paracnuella aquatica]